LYNVLDSYSRKMTIFVT